MAAAATRGSPLIFVFVLVCSSLDLPSLVLPYVWPLDEGLLPARPIILSPSRKSDWIWNRRPPSWRFDRLGASGGWLPWDLNVWPGCRVGLHRIPHPGVRLGLTFDFHVLWWSALGLRRCLVGFSIVTLNPSSSLPSAPTVASSDHRCPDPPALILSSRAVKSQTKPVQLSRAAKENRAVPSSRVSRATIQAISRNKLHIRLRLSRAKPRCNLNPNQAPFMGESQYWDPGSSLNSKDGTKALSMRLKHTYAGVVVASNVVNKRTSKDMEVILEEEERESAPFHQQLK